MYSVAQGNNCGVPYKVQQDLFGNYYSIAKTFLIYTM